MADTNILQSINIGGKRFSVPACWEELGLTKAYMLALLSRDEYTPTLKFKPDETVTIYTDPDSGNPAGFHEGQCVIYPDVEAPDGIGMSVAKQVTVNEQGVPTTIVWLHLGDIDKHSKWINDIANTKFTELTDSVGSLRNDVSALKTKSTTIERQLTKTHTMVEEDRTKLSDTNAKVAALQTDVTGVGNKVEALESRGCFIAYWPSLSDKKYYIASLDEWPEIKKGNSEVVALGILVVPDMGEPFIVSLTEVSSKWASSAIVVYPDGASTELTAHFNNTVSVTDRHVALIQSGKCTAANILIDHHYEIDGTFYGPIPWNLPDLKTMMTMKKYLNGINKCLLAIDGAEELCCNGDDYWTANEKSGGQAVAINLYNGFIKGSSKLNDFNIRPVGFLEF